MNKPLLGLLLGAALGAIDGASAMIDAQWDPELRAGILGIVVGSTMKGLLAGVLTGFVARQVRSLTPTVLFGVIVSGVLAFLVAALQGKYYLRITLPGMVLGAIVGYATVRYGALPKRAEKQAAM